MKKSYYFIGIGGIGMSGLAKILRAWGNKVTGSDPATNNETEKLEQLGITVHHSQVAENITTKYDHIVITAAIPESNPELARARELGLRILKRSELLNEIITTKRAIAVTGTHGKTTTSSMLAGAMISAGLDPLVSVGAEVTLLMSNARDGKGEYSVAEVCEYQRAFLDIHPFAAIITNIDADHLDCYKDIDDIKETFAKFVTQIDPNGFLVYCADDANTAEVARSAKLKTISYGVTSGEYQATNISFDKATTTYSVKKSGEKLVDITLHVPGEHNVLNSLAVIALADYIGADMAKVVASLAEFSGAERRFQLKGTYHGATVIDDYAHHPTEIRATLAAARGRYPKQTIIAVFQPHQHSRTRQLLSDFATAFADADVVLVPEIYAVRDSAADIASVSSADLVSLINEESPGKARYFRDFNETVTFLRAEVVGGDIVITIGAGPVNKVGEELLGQ